MHNHLIYLIFCTFMILVSLILVLYTLFPNYYYRNISKKIIKRIPDKNKIFLTFDDGPDERFTPKLLQILNKNDIKCTFFLVAEKASKNKDIVLKMKETGHTIGLHSYCHKSAWLSSPSETKKDFIKSLEFMNSIGIKVNFFRPPWGAFNLCTYHFAKKYNFITVLWSVDVVDWSNLVSTDFIKSRLLKKVASGDIIVLHDSSSNENIPVKNLKVLDEILPVLKKRGFQFVTLDELYNKNNQICP